MFASETMDAGAAKEEEIIETSEPIAYEWGVPLLLQEEEDDRFLEMFYDNEDTQVSEKSLMSDSTLHHEGTRFAGEELADSPHIRLAAVKETNFPRFGRRHSSEYFCKKLHLNLKEPSKPRAKLLEVTIDFSKVSPKWEKDIQHALAAIQEAAPGLLFIPPIKSKPADIYVDKEPDPMKDSNTRGSIRSPRRFFRGEIKSKSLIRLDFHLESLKRTTEATHEILHALGFEHEHQRHDAGHYLKVFKEFRFDDQVMSNPFMKPLTPFDPYSIMLYKVGDYFSLRGDEKNCYENDHMSEWDKIALNMTYPPARVEGVYDPVLVPETGMYYCGRSVMDNHNQPGPHIVTTCGPHTDPNHCSNPGGGPNCPACRVLSRPRNLNDNKWQGRTGFVYCGRRSCGPDYGEPCTDCGRIINYEN